MLVTSTALIVTAGMCLVAPEIYYFAMRNPEYMYEGIEIVNDIINPSLLPSTTVGQLYFMYDRLTQ